MFGTPDGVPELRTGEGPRYLCVVSSNRSTLMLMRHLLPPTPRRPIQQAGRRRTTQSSSTPPPPPPTAQLLISPKLAFVPSLPRKLTHPHRHSGPFAFQACSSSSISASQRRGTLMSLKSHYGLAHFRMRHISFGFAVTARK